MGYSIRFVGMVAAIVLTNTFTIFSAQAQPVLETKVALLGDTGADVSFAAVMQLTAAENADVVMINGDFGYDEKSTKWETTLRGAIDTNKHLIIGSLGNHDVLSAKSYVKIFQGFRTQENGLLTKCSGEPKVSSNRDRTIIDEVCTFGNVSIVSSAIGQIGLRSQFEKRLEQKLKAVPEGNWSLVGYHFTLSSMNPGLKPNENTHKFFDIIRQYGAIGAQAHTHSVMASCPIVSPFINGRPIQCHPDFTNLDQRFIAPGTSVYVDSSVGGKAARPRGRCSKPNSADCVHMVDLVTREGYTRVDGQFRQDFKRGGAMFIVFNAGGDPNKARVYYKSVDGQEIFSFFINR
jgi:hypothetical protein